MPEPRPSEEQWELLKTTIELADVSNALRVVAVACADSSVVAALRSRLRDFCEHTGRPFLEPAEGEDVLDWLSGLRRAPTDKGGDHEAPILFLPLPAVKETFILHRLNENRDNLRGDLRGVLCLVGVGDFWRRMSSEAPDLWSVRDRSFELTSLTLPKGVARGEAVQEPTPASAPTGGGEAQDEAASGRDVLLSYSRRDKEQVAALREMLEEHGLRCTMMAELDGAEMHSSHDARDAVERAFREHRYVVIAASPDYVASSWMHFIPELIDAHEDAARGKIIVLTVRECVVPAPLRSLGIIDWTTQESRERSKGRLLQALRTRHREDPTPSKELTPPPRPPFAHSRLGQYLMVAVAALVLIVFVLVRWHLDRFPVEGIFPGFGWGQVHYAFGEGAPHPATNFRKCAYTPEYWGKCLHGPEGDVFSIVAPRFQSGIIQISLERYFGGADLTHEDASPPTLHGMTFAIHSEAAFWIGLLDTSGQGVWFQCPASTLLEPVLYRLRGASPDTDYQCSGDFDCTSVHEIQIRIDKEPPESGLAAGSSKEALQLQLLGISREPIDREPSIMCVLWQKKPASSP